MTGSNRRRDRQDDDVLARAQARSPWLADRLVAWQRQSGRHHLPWQSDRSPYRVWLSEIMLQQTQVTTVLGYFERFLQRYPTVADLAAAHLDDVLALWSGLGYYSRARNLHRCAQAVVAEHGGAFPSDSATLQTLPGIGPSTAAAIASFCFGERTSIMDGNVKRVLSRVLGFEGDLSERVHEKALIAAAAALLPQHSQDMVAYTQGLMDLGATVCMPRKAACLVCPWQEACVGREQGEPERLPIKTRKLKRGEREHWWLWLQWGERVWLQQMPQTGVWAGLWTLPLFDSEDELVAWCGPDAPRIALQPRIKHVLTHLDWHLHPRRLVWPEGELPQDWVDRLSARDPRGRWVAPDALPSLGLPAALTKLLG